jgi:protein gp37
VTWNPVTGCSKVSQGCKNCYAERMAKRLQAMGMYRYRNSFSVTLQEDLLVLPLQWKSPRIVFVNSMSDLFHDEIPLDYIRRVFSVMQDCPRHTFQVLTKRSQRLRDVASFLPWPKNVWMGVSVENAAVLPRIGNLQAVPAAVRFLSIEPLLGSDRRPPSRWHRLGDRGWRVWSPCATHARGVGALNLAPVQGERCGVLL